jgi:hypothetical protein
MTEQFMNIEKSWGEPIQHAHIDGAPDPQTPALPLQRARHAPPVWHAMRVAIGLVCLWSILETPWEFGPSDGVARIIALLLSKCVLLGAGAAAFFGLSYARPLFVFLCGSSVIAVASSLPFEFTISHELFALSLIECVLKAALVASFAIGCLKRQ